jgi:hypothetical protein
MTNAVRCGIIRVIVLFDFVFQILQLLSVCCTQFDIEISPANQSRIPIRMYQTDVLSPRVESLKEKIIFIFFLMTMTNATVRFSLFKTFSNNVALVIVCVSLFFLLSLLFLFCLFHLIRLEKNNKKLKRKRLVWCSLSLCVHIGRQPSPASTHSHTDIPFRHVGCLSASYPLASSIHFLFFFFSFFFEFPSKEKIKKKKVLLHNHRRLITQYYAHCIK